jgi:hypothetical protein
MNEQDEPQIGDVVLVGDAHAIVRQVGRKDGEVAVRVASGRTDHGHWVRSALVRIVYRP